MSTAAIIKMIVLYSSMYGIDSDLALSIAKVESSLNPNAVGLAGEIGLFQIMPQYVAVKSDALKNPYMNTVVAMKKLADKKKNCIHRDDKTWVICYNRGMEGAKKVADPYSDKYYVKVMKEYNSIKTERILYGKNLASDTNSN